MGVFMNKVIATLLLSLASFSSYAAETVRFASSATYPPFEYYDGNNQIIGFDMDLAKALCKEMQVECTFTNQSFDSLIASLKFRRYDAVISGMDITAERSKQVLFTNPYYANSAVFIGKKGQYLSIDQLKGKRVGMENGTTHQKYIHDKQPEITTVSYESYQTAIIDLNNGRLDAVFGDTAVVNEWLKQYPELAKIGETVTDPSYFGTGMGIAVRAGNTELAEKFNQALTTIKANGVYQSINDKWFPENQ
jgi:arginine transport system substrate-binding protein